MLKNKLKEVFMDVIKAIWAELIIEVIEFLKKLRDGEFKNDKKTK